MAKVFISYRRTDTTTFSGRIYDRLVLRFGKKNVFKDVDDIPPGVNFGTYIQAALRQCAVALIIIGHQWLDTSATDGERRLEHPNDWVRLEVETALSLGLTVIPVLVDGARMPNEDALPHPCSRSRSSTPSRCATIPTSPVTWSGSSRAWSVRWLHAGQLASLAGGRVGPRRPPASRTSTQPPRDMVAEPRPDINVPAQPVAADVLPDVVSVGEFPMEPIVAADVVPVVTPVSTPIQEPVAAEVTLPASRISSSARPVTPPSDVPTPRPAGRRSMRAGLLAGVATLLVVASLGVLFNSLGLRGGAHANTAATHTALRTATPSPSPSATSSPQFLSAFTLPNHTSPGITSGPDGDVWFTEASPNGPKIGQITPTGHINEYPLPRTSWGASYPWAITLGPDGNLWFTDICACGNLIGRITPTGSITEYPILTYFSEPWGIATGPDGNVWFTEYDGNKIGRITPSGSITEYPLPGPASGPRGIATGPDGNLWFTGYDGNKIGRITPTGHLTEYPIPTRNIWANAITSGPGGPDGNLWFTNVNANTNDNYRGEIGRISPTGVITEYPIPTAHTLPEGGITRGPDGNLWFTELAPDGGKIGRITPTGRIVEYAVPVSTTPSPFADVTSGPDGNLWFTVVSYPEGKIGVMAP
jgi:streptogramin lyase